MNNISLWQSLSNNPKTYPKLNENIDIDVAIIGGGITGITAALSLIERGQKIAILESHRIGGVTTSFSTGNLYIAVQPYYQNIIRKLGKDKARIVAHSRKYAIDYIEKITKELDIDCNFARRPWFLYTADYDKISFLEREVKALTELDIDIKYTDEMPLKLKHKKAAVIENQARFDPLKYVVSIAEKLNEKGCLIFEDTQVLNVEEKNNICYLKTKNYDVTAKKIIIATHTPIGVNLSQILTAPYRSYAVGAFLESNIYPEGNFWDLESESHAISTQSLKTNHPEILIVANSDHKTGQGKNMNQHYDILKDFLRKNFLIKEFAFQWSAQHYRSADDIPYIGLKSRRDKNTYIATGYFADGLVYGTLAGIILSDLILGKQNLDAKTYDYNRLIPIASTPFLLKEGSNVFLQYLKDLPIFNQKSYHDLKPGQAKIIEEDMEKWAVFCDEKNKFHKVSAVCTHMKGIVNWNNAEKTWDCPCHGSRFTIDGQVIEGPAILPLRKKS